MIESLNLGTTSGIVLYEITKQRREYQKKYKWRNKRGEKVMLNSPVASGQGGTIEGDSSMPAADEREHG
ncbi:MAG TPA: hypothetical protein V6C50_08195, partial [Crinalium sp.]